MKRYLVRVEYSGFEKVWVDADDAEEAKDLASEEVANRLIGIYDIDDAEICKVDGEA